MLANDANEAVEHKLKSFGRTLELGPLAVFYFAFASGLSAAIAAFLSNVADTIKTRWQVFSSDEHDNVLELVRSMWRDGGLSIFFQGAGARVLWAVPNIMISFTLYEILKIPQ